MASKRRASGEGGLFKNPKGLWVGSVEIPSTDGKRRQKRVSSKDRNETIRKLNKLRAEIDRGRIPVTGKATVESWLTRYFEIRSAGEHALRPEVRNDYIALAARYITPVIGTKRLEQLTPQHVRDMQSTIPHSRTAQVAHDALRGALKWALREGLVDRNVAQIAGKPGHITTARQPLTADQAKRLLRSAINRGDPFATRWATALLLGARQGEVIGLQWQRSDPAEIGLDVDAGIAAFEWQLQQLTQAHGCGDRHSDGTWPCGRQRPGWCPQRTWPLDRGFEHHVLHRSLVLTRPKTKAGVRVVPLPAPLWAMLNQMPRTTPNPHSLVWCEPDGRPINPRHDYERWQSALSDAGLPAAPLHIARNTCATLLAEAGVPEDIRMAILGQVSITAHRAYIYRDQAKTRLAMDAALGQLLS